MDFSIIYCLEAIADTNIKTSMMIGRFIMEINLVIRYVEFITCLMVIP